LNTIHFISSNKQKQAALQQVFDSKGVAVNVASVNLDIIEPQANSVAEVSKAKAITAYEKLGKPILVEDGGFAVEALNGFPGVYSKYILQTIGVEGLLRLMNGKDERTCKFLSTTTFIDSDGEIYQFERLGGTGLLATEISAVESEYAWSDFWKVYQVPMFSNKLLCELNKNELDQMWNADDQKGSLAVFAEWYAETYMKR